MFQRSMPQMCPCSAKRFFEKERIQFPDEFSRNEQKKASTEHMWFYYAPLLVKSFASQILIETQLYKNLNNAFDFEFIQLEEISW